MKITDIYKTPPLSATQSITDGQTSGVGHRPASVAAKHVSDRSELSSVASLATQPTEDRRSPERAAKIAHLTSEFQAGRYETDSTKLSQALLQSALNKGLIGE